MVLDAVTAVAEEIGTSAAAVALAWLRRRPGTVIPIVGARRLEHLERNLEALAVELTPAQIDALDAASTPTLNYPADLNRAVGPMLQFAGVTVDGVPSTVYPPLLQGAIR